MEESVTVLKAINTVFGCEEADLRGYSPLTLAFIGDCVYSLVVRTVLVERGNRPVQTLHRQTSALVKAGTQAALADALSDVLTEEETTVYRRGRNAQSHTMAKNATVSDYRKATGLEALCGYLYLQGKTGRMLELVKLGFDRLKIVL